MGQGRRVYISHDRVEVGKGEESNFAGIFLSTMILSSGTVRLRGLYRQFPNRRTNSVGVPTWALNPEAKRTGKRSPVIGTWRLRQIQKKIQREAVAAEA